MPQVQSPQAALLFSVKYQDPCHTLLWEHQGLDSLDNQLRSFLDLQVLAKNLVARRKITNKGERNSHILIGVRYALCSVGISRPAFSLLTLGFH